MPLSMVKNGMSVIITHIEKSPEIKSKLKALGIVKGTQLTVLSSEFGGPMVVQLRGTQLALGHEMLVGIHVKTHTTFLQEVSA